MINNLKKLFFSLSISFFFNNSVLAQEVKLSSYKIIGIGEASHGEKNIYEFRYGMLKEMLKLKHEIEIAIEMPHFARIGIIDYFNEKITKDSLIETLEFYGLKTNSFFNLLDSCKQYKERINFYGVDMQDHLKSYLYLSKKHNVKYKSDNLDKNLHLAFSKSSNPDSLLKVLNQDFSLFKKQIMSSIKTSGMSNISCENATSFIEIIEQAIKYSYLNFTAPYKASVFRDSCMYENTHRIEKSNDNPVLLFGASYHLSKLDRTCGWFLDKYYGSDYYVFAQQFVTGEVLTVDFSEGNRKIVTKEVNIFKRGLPWKLKRAGLNESTSVIDIKQQSGRLKKLLNSKVFFLDFGGYLNPKLKRNYIFLNPDKAYDAIYYHYQAEKSIFLEPH